MTTNASSPAPLQMGSGAVLTVGAGMEFATLGDACKAAVAGDTIAVQAGTYVNDFATVTCAVKIVSIGGLVDEVATVEPPNGKALLLADASLTIQGFTFTGGSDGSPDGNVSGIRLENGNLNVSYCYFHDMEEGVLAGADSTASITIDHSEFARNGSGDGYSHNLYAGAIASLTVTNSYFTASDVGHEIKSRAAVTNISNNVIADGPTGTGSYDIDLPNGGVATITNNVIEKGPLSSNVYAIHYSGETQFTYAKNALTVTGNTILNDAGPNGLAVLNQDYLNGLDVKANVSHNSFYGFAPGRLLYGNGTLSANTTLATEPGYSTASPYTAVPLLALAAGPQLLNLTNSNHDVSGGAVRLTVMDTGGGSNTINGGAGGINVTDSQGWDTISTAAGASDAIILGGRNAVLHSAGNDHIAAPGFYEDIYVTGPSTITGSAFNSYNLDGAGEKLTASGSGVIDVGAAGAAGITITGGDFNLSVLAGGRAAISNQAAAAPPNDGAATVSGAATGYLSHGGSVSLTLGDSGATVQAGGGVVDVTCGAGADSLTAGTGADSFVLGSGADHVVFGAGAATVTAGSGVDTYVFQSGQHGTETINGFRPGHDVLSYKGFSGAAVTAGVVAGGSTVLTLADGTSVTFAGVVLPGYGQAAPAAPPAPTPPGGITAPSPGSGATVLASGLHVLTGGAALLAVQDLAGNNTISGGAGGLMLSGADTDVVSTKAGSSNTVTLSRWDTLTGAGSDQVTVSGYANQISESGASGVVLLGGNNAVQGGSGLLTVSDQVGGDAVIGGTGGLTAALAADYDTVATAQGAADSISLAGKSMLVSQGTDHISLAGWYNQVTVTGAASITAGAGLNSYLLEGAATLASAGASVVTVGGAASVSIGSAGLDDLSVDKLAGGAAMVSASVAGGLASLTVCGGAATISASAGAYASLSATLGAGDTVTAGAGNVTLFGGAGHDSFAGGSGQAFVTLGGDDTVSLGAGLLSVQGGTSDVFAVPVGASGTLVIDNWSAQDSLVTPGQAAPDVVSQSVSGGADWLSFAGGAHVELVGVTHFG